MCTHKYHQFKARIGGLQYEGLSPSLDIEDLVHSAIDIVIRSCDEIRDDRYIDIEIDFKRDAVPKTVMATVVVSHVMRVQITKTEETL